jgi:hypothetical protein
MSRIPGSLLYSPSKAEIRAARVAGMAPAREIAELCTKEGKPELAAEAIAAGMTLDQVRARLAAGARSEPGDGAATLVDALAHRAARLSREQAAEMWDRAFAAARGADTRH